MHGLWEGEMIPVGGALVLKFTLAIPVDMS